MTQAASHFHEIVEYDWDTYEMHFVNYDAGVPFSVSFQIDPEYYSTEEIDALIKDNKFMDEELHYLVEVWANSYGLENDDIENYNEGLELAAQLKGVYRLNDIIYDDLGDEFFNLIPADIIDEAQKSNEERGI